MGAEGGRASSRLGVPSRRRFAVMYCPYLHEVHRTTRRRQQEVRLSVPGMKQHVRRVHGEEAYQRMKWPDLYPNMPVRFRPKGGLAAMSLNELRQEASRLGFDPRGLSKVSLAREILQRQ